MRNLLSVVFATTLLGLPSAAVAQKVETDYAHGTDFSKYKTYNWTKLQDSSDTNQLVDQRITAALEEELAKEGLTKNENNPDVLVGYQTAITQQVQLHTFSTQMGPSWGYGPRWGYGWGGGFSSGTSTTTTSTIPRGTLTVSMFDPQQKQLVFRGVAQDTLTGKPEKDTKKIQKAVVKIFEKYPPKERG
ncbi:MAG: DUF4136 domain-containing protein [Acidobacteriaceae bacterium]|nr:DUF4136 domain-containing protein [Acidobacteriaceae bacterium]MBV9503045.1 DUF4136 domain-containing protein [Acidobacteriaceae bacterium]